jgi:hypothetical protein
VKLSQFNDLCVREWAKPRRGDVVSLHLTEASAAELRDDALLNGAQNTCVVPPIDAVVNPVTRTVATIRIKKTGVRDTVRVMVMGGTYRQTWWPASP